jgi:glycosyltransferase
MKISVIIPVYNVEQYIARCLDSILAQSFQDFEIVIVDDCGTDNSMIIVEQYISKDDRFVVCHNKQNMGPMWARREGYLNARGEYFVFCDSDDYLLPDSLELLHEAISSTQADIVASSYVRHTFREKDVVLYNKLSHGEDSISVYKSLLSGEISHSLWAKIFSANLFRDYLYETKDHQTNSEDALLFYQVVEHAKKVVIIQDPTYCYVFNSTSSTLRDTRSKLPQILFFQHWRFNFLKSKNDLLEYLIKFTILKRVDLMKYNVSSHILFSEEDLRKHISLHNLLNIFSSFQAFILYLKIHCFFFPYLANLKYTLQMWILRNF